MILLIYTFMILKKLIGLKSSSKDLYLSPEDDILQSLLEVA